MDKGEGSARGAGPAQPVAAEEGEPARWLTTDPGASAAPWIGWHLARAMVAKAAGFSDGGATDWLTSISRPPHPWLASRFSPRKLAAREQGSGREHLRDHDPAMIVRSWDGEPPDVARCPWFPPVEALERGRDPASGLRLEDVEWREDELGPLLARRFAGRPWWGTGGLPEAGGGPPPWITFPLARGEVARALRYPEDAAAEWLRRAAIDLRVPVRYPPKYQLRQDANRRLDAHPSNLTHEQRATEKRHWFTPVDDMEAGPPAMTSHSIVSCSEWDADTLSVALAAGAPVSPTATPMAGDPAGSNRTRKDGRPPGWPWPEIMAEAAEKFAREGGMKQEALCAELQKIAQGKNKRKPGHSTVKPYAKRILDGWKRDGGK